MGSKVGQILKAAAPAIAGSLILGPAGLGLASAGVGGAIGGGAAGLIGGGGIKGTALGALSGYGTGALGGTLASAASNALSASGIGAAADAVGPFTGAGGALNVFGNSISPGVTSFLTHPLDSIGSGLSSLGSTLASAASNPGAAIGNIGSSISGLLGGGASAPATNAAADAAWQGALNGNGSFANADAIANAAGAGGASSSLANFANTGNTGLFSGGQGGGASSFGGLGLGSILSAASGIMNSSAITDAQKQLMAAQGQNQKNNAPFLASGTAADKTLSDALGTSGNTGASNYGSLTTPYTPGDLSQDPGYQFQMQQGNLAQERAASAGGMLDSGAALKAAQQFGQGLAGTTYNNAFQRDLSTKQNNYNMLAGQTNVGVQAANNGVGINNAIGNIGASGTIAQNNNLTNTAANLAGRTVIGYDINGKPIYS